MARVGQCSLVSLGGYVLRAGLRSLCFVNVIYFFRSCLLFRLRGGGFCISCTLLMWAPILVRGLSPPSHRFVNVMPRSVPVITRNKTRAGEKVHWPD